MGWTDEYITHLAEVEYYANGRSAKVMGRLKSLEASLGSLFKRNPVLASKERVRKFCSECDRAIDSAVRKIASEEKIQRARFASREAEFIGGLMVGSGKSSGISKRKVAKMLDAPFLSFNSFDDFMEYVRAKLRQAVRKAANASYSFGTSVGNVSDTAVPRVIEEAGVGMHMAVTAEQRDIQMLMQSSMKPRRAVRYEYVSLLDDRTCLACGALSGTVYGSLSDAPRLPMHPRCRCFYVPIEGDSPAIGRETFAEWLDSQPDSTQYKVLGPSRYALRKAGVTVSQFSPDGRTLSLGELYKSSLLKKK